MTGYRLIEASTEESLVWIELGFEKRPYLPDTLIKKYELEGCIYSRNPFYSFESLRFPCVNLKLSLKNLNVLL
jgi:hypothetical protein